MINDNLDLVWHSFFKDRSSFLWERYIGPFLGEIVETNDPLGIRRVRIRIPELHDRSLKPEECQWAKRINQFGDKGAGSWDNLNIGDIVLIFFEKNHPYVPLCMGAAPPTRRRSYPLPSIYTRSPLAVKEDGSPDTRPDDFLEEYLPKDGRPMSFGSKDRYGNQILSSSVGFFPKEHSVKPAPNGTDAISGKEFDISQNKPAVNDPDLKYINFITKGGHSILLSDVGYQWDKEFNGDFVEDQQFEEDRHKYLLQLINENNPKEDDQRRLAMFTRYGHKFEMRDTGWNKTRKDEYSQEEKVISETDKDYRWIKIRTKAGHLIQAIDRGADSIENLNVKRLLKDEVGASDEEDEWGDDARQIRFITAHGNKFVLDDVGSDSVDPMLDSTRGNGFLLRTKRGFAIDANDKDDANRLMIVSPDDQVIDINDRDKYILLTTKQGAQLHEDFQGLKKNEFHRKNGMVNDPESNTFHLKLDDFNQRLRLKSPQKQGIEVRENGSVWVEIRDSQDRGLYLSSNNDLGAWRGRGDRQIVIHDGERKILVRNGDGSIQISAQSAVEIIADGDISLVGDNINIKARQQIRMDAGGGKLTLNSGQLGANVTYTGPTVQGFLPGAAIGNGAPNNGSSIGNDFSDPIPNNFSPLKPGDFDSDRGFDLKKNTNIELNEDFFNKGNDEDPSSLIFS